MAILVESKQTPKHEPGAAGNQSVRLGLSPTVEKMFGVLVDKLEEPKEVTSSESGATQPKRPSAA